MPPRLGRVIYDWCEMRRALFIAVLTLLIADASGLSSLLVPETCAIDAAILRRTAGARLSVSGAPALLCVVGRLHAARRTEDRLRCLLCLLSACPHRLPTGSLSRSCTYRSRSYVDAPTDLPTFKERYVSPQCRALVLSCVFGRRVRSRHAQVPRVATGRRDRDYGDGRHASCSSKRKSSSAARPRETDANGRLTLQVAPGPIEITVVKEGFNPVTVTATAIAGQSQVIPIPLERQTAIEEHVTVSATRTDKRIEDQPMRVEVLDAEEIEEKQLMTPGDIVMMLNEMGGLRVQATSPSLGAASVRVQGMRGRYTRFLSDGLPLFGADVGGLGLLQIPPTDLGQVEVIKGVASALYGAGALGGVVDLISSRPTKEPTREAMVNRTSRGGTDAILFAAQPFTERWSGDAACGGTLAGAQRRRRRRLGRPRGLLARRRPSARCSGAMAPADRSLRRRCHVGAAPWRHDAVRGVAGDRRTVSSNRSTRRASTVALVAQTPLRGRYVMTARVSRDAQGRSTTVAATSREHDLQDTVFAELAVRGTAPRQTWVGGIAFERSTLDPRDQPHFAYAYNVPGVFAAGRHRSEPMADHIGSGRVDVHNLFGTFFSPRISAFAAARSWTSACSVGQRVLCADGADRGDRGRRARPSVDPDGRSKRSADGARRSMSRSVQGPVTVTATLFRYEVHDPAVVDRATYTLASLSEPTITSGIESVATFRRAPFSVTGTYTYVHSREGIGSSRNDIPLTPRHSAGLVGMWEREEPRTSRRRSVLHRALSASRTTRTDRRARVTCSSAVSSSDGSVASDCSSTPRTWVESVRLGSIRSCVPFKRPTDGGPSTPGRHSTGA